MVFGIGALVSHPPWVSTGTLFGGPHLRNHTCSANACNLLLTAATSIVRINMARSRTVTLPTRSMPIRRVLSCVMVRADSVPLQC